MLVSFSKLFWLGLTLTPTLRAEQSIDMDRDGGTVQLVIAVVFGTSAVVAVVLRIISRRLSQVYLKVNDYMIMFALVHQLDSFQTNKTRS